MKCDEHITHCASPEVTPCHIDRLVKALIIDNTMTFPKIHWCSTEYHGAPAFSTAVSPGTHLVVVKKFDGKTVYYGLVCLTNHSVRFSVYEYAIASEEDTELQTLYQFIKLNLSKKSRASSVKAMYAGPDLLGYLGLILGNDLNL